MAHFVWPWGTSLALYLFSIPLLLSWDGYVQFRSMPLKETRVPLGCPGSEEPHILSGRVMVWMSLHVCPQGSRPGKLLPTVVYCDAGTVTSYEVLRSWRYLPLPTEWIHVGLFKVSSFLFLCHYKVSVSTHPPTPMRGACLLPFRRPFLCHVVSQPRGCHQDGGTMLLLKKCIKKFF